MDAPRSDSWLYDPAGSGAVVRAHRPAGGGAATSVVSDAFWGDVLSLVRWARATSACPADLRPGAAWRTATAAAGLLRRLPDLCDELGVTWRVPDAGVPAAGSAWEALQRSADRLADRLGTPGDRTPVHELADDVAALGAAAVTVLVADTDWGRRS
jgi:hypothetical protein